MKPKADKTDELRVAGYLLGLMLLAVRWGDLRLRRLEQFNRKLAEKNDEQRREIERLQRLAGGKGRRPALQRRRDGAKRSKERQGGAARPIKRQRCLLIFLQHLCGRF
jgi:hypothetical protein